MAHSKGALFAALTIACLLALGIGQADAQRLSGLRGFLTRLGTRQHQGEATFAAENEGGAAKEGHTLSTSRYSSLDKSDTLMDLTDSSYARVVPLQDELPNYSSWTICPDSVSLSADVTHASAIGSPLFLTNGTQAGQIAELGREVIHGRHCLLSTLNAYSHSEKRYANLMKSYEALVSEKENLEGQLREKQQGRMERILLWTVIICGVTCFLARSKVGAALTFLSRAIGRSKARHRPFTSEQASRQVHLLWEEGNSKYSGSGALFVESRTDSSQFYLLVPVNLGAGRPFALFGTGGDYESDLEKAEAYVAGRNRGRLSIILYKHGGGLFEAQELERVERAYGNIFSVVGRTTGVKVLLLVAHERLSGHSLRVWDSAGESEWETDIVAREAWGSILLRDHH